MTFSTIKGFDEISNLSKETLDKILRKPDQSAIFIQQITSQLFEVIPHTQETTPLDQFLHSIIYINEQYQTLFSKSPFQESIQKLQKALSQLTPTSYDPKIDPAPSSHKENLETQFRNLLQALDLESPSLATKIKELINLLQTLKSLHVVSESQYKQISHALRSLHEKGHYKEQFFEKRAWNTLSDLSPSLFKVALIEAEPILKKVEQSEGSQSMLNHLKQPYLSLAELADTLPSQWNTIQNQLMHTRTEIIFSKMPDYSLLPKETRAILTQNFFLLKEALENFSLNIANPIFSKEWQILRNTFERVSQNKLFFCQVLKNYSYMDPEAWLPELILEAEQKYKDPLKLEDLFLLTPSNFKQKMTELAQTSQQQIRDFFRIFYKESFYQRHLWLFSNLPFLKQSYNQAEDIHRNQATGTCFQNSLERHLLLLKSPTIQAAQITMGSSTLGR